VHAVYTLFDATTGAPRAMLDGTELTLRRTAAASALAARYLAPPEASRLLMVGTGSLAPHAIENHAAVRPIRSVRIWGRRPERANAVARSLGGKHYEIEAVEDLQSAVAWADIVSCATLAAAPLVRGAWLRPGQHIDLIGSFTPRMREADDEVMVRAAIYVDTRAGALADSGELVHALAAGLISRAAASAGGATPEKSRCSKASAVRSRIWQRPSWPSARKEASALAVFLMASL
jgi:ornithine cyclodeaminase